ncbi:T9SS C-terminal target domain-containing protein [Dysgonomonas sp. 216]|uniref:T9SS type A sorting domain-containing protein n=1 Tax=Dysgonomonas sp. 216 TaxID=2302934 RepID=UPI0013CF80C0|nr:T9SS type A sorting domain-containing protein [Dysgonomonas sp. 216]NDW18453.1 T9SS C-terminal target domain-containing protein [Dysgonomonas sp. 216]
MEKIKLLLLTVLCFTAVFKAGSQTNPCESQVSLSARVVDSRCVAMGQVYVDFTFAEGSINADNYKFMVSQQNDIDELSFQPSDPEEYYWVNVGKYYVYVKYLCNLSGQNVILRSGPYEVGRSFTPFAVSSYTYSTYRSLTCGGVDQKKGSFSREVSGGRSPFRFIIDEAPAAYTGTKDTTITSTSGRARVNFTKVPAGTYKVRVQDSCVNEVTFDVIEITAVENNPTFTHNLVISGNANPFGPSGNASVKIGSYTNPAGAYVSGNANIGYFYSYVKLTSYPESYKGSKSWSISSPSTSVTLSSSTNYPFMPGNYAWEMTDPCGNIIASSTFTITSKDVEPIASDYILPDVYMSKDYDSDGYSETHPNDYSYCYDSFYDNYYHERLQNDMQVRVVSNPKYYNSAKYSLYTYPEDFDISFYEQDGTLVETYNLRDIFYTKFYCNDYMGGNTEPRVKVAPNMEVILPSKRYSRDSLMIDHSRLYKATITNRYDTDYSVFAPVDYLLQLPNPPSVKLADFGEYRFRGASDCFSTLYYNPSRSHTVLNEGLYGVPFKIVFYDGVTNDSLYTITAGTSYSANDIYSLPYGKNTTPRWIVSPEVGDQFKIKIFDNYGQLVGEKDFTAPTPQPYTEPAITAPSISVSILPDSCGYYPNKVAYFRLDKNYSINGGTLKLVSAPAGIPSGVLGVTRVIPKAATSYHSLYPFNLEDIKVSSGTLDLPAGTYTFLYTDSCGREAPLFSKHLSYSADKPYIFSDTPPEITAQNFDCTGTTYTFGNWKNVIEQTPYPYRSHYIRISGKNINSYGCCYDDWSGGSCPFVDWELAWEHGGSYCVNDVSNSNSVSFKVTDYMDTIRIKVYASINYSADTLNSCQVREYMYVLKGGFVEFDTEITGGYRCPGAEVGVGTILIKAKNGIGPYEYSLFANRDDAVNGVAIETNTTGEFSGWPATGSDIFYAQITDKGCNEYKVTGIVTLQDLGNAALLSVTGDPRKCYGDSAQLVCVPLGETNYYWYNADKTWEVRDTRTPVVSADVLMAKGTDTYTAEIGIPQCFDGLGQPITITRSLEVSVAPTVMYWNPDATDKNWNKTDNWLNQDGSMANAVPAPCTTVHILSNDGGNYPWLDPANTPALGKYGYPACDTIIYYHGSETVYPQYLQYNLARIRYNFGAYNGSFVNNSQPGNNMDELIYPNVFAPEPMQRAYWYSLSAPLKKMTGGDFGVGPYPQIYQRAFMVVDPVGATPGYNSFSKTFAKANIDLGGGTNYNALAIWMPPYRSADHRYKNQTTLEALDGNIEIPYFNNPRIMQHLDYHEYDEATETMKFLYYDYTKPPYELTGSYDEIVRGLEAFRFIYENSYNRLDSITYQGKRVESYTMPLDAESVGKSIMMGNPFMAHLNFDKLYEANSQTIENYYEIYDGSGSKTFDVYAPDVPGGGTITTPYIKPLQAVAIKVKESPVSNSIIFPMGGITEGYSVMALNAGDTRSSRVRSSDQGWIEMYGIVPPAVSGGDSVRIQSKLMFNCFGSNKGKTVYPASYTEKAETFFIDGVGTANMYQYEQNNTEIVKLGLQSQYQGLMRLRFEIKENLPADKVILVDKHLNNNMMEIRRGVVNNYDFIHRYDKTESGQKGLDTDRFELRFAYNSVGMDPLNGDEVIIGCDGYKLAVSSSGKFIESVALVDMHGRIIVAEAGIASLYYEKVYSDDIPSGVYFAKVILADGSSEIKKIVIK